VGLIEFDLIDVTRTAPLAPEPTPQRRLKVMAWYPASAADGYPVRHYFEPREAEPAVQSVLSLFQAPAAVYPRLAALETCSHVAAPALPGAHPLLVFCHGLMSYPHQSMTLMEHLASHGYVVASIGHPFESGSHFLTDGTLLALSPSIERDFPVFSYIPANLATYFAHSLEERRRAAPAMLRAVRRTCLARMSYDWADDAVYVADCCEDRRLPPSAAFLQEAIDLGRLGYIGMSFGGHVAALCGLRDPRTRAVANLDGGLFTAEVFGRELGVPCLMLMGDNALKGQLSANQALPPVTPEGLGLMDVAYERFDGTPPAEPVHRITLPGSLHGDFTDLPVLLHGAMTIPGFLSELDPAGLTVVQCETVRGFFDAYVKSCHRVFPGDLGARYPELIVHRRHAGAA
jgi:predicted dienelactone hydrolase